MAGVDATGALRFPLLTMAGIAGVSLVDACAPEATVLLNVM
jgi:hypothetical protein